MAHPSTFNHSFSVDLASQYGIEEAIVIHHFQYWTRHNRELKRNQHDGRTWTYQTREEISAHFPYWSPDKVRRYLDSLVSKEILIKGNFNKTPFDRTVWYAFKDEEEFLNTVNSNSSYVGRKCQMDRANPPNQLGQFAQPIPDTITHAETEECKNPPASPPSAGAESLTDYFLTKIRERNPKFKEPNRKQWLKDFDLLLRVDERDLQETKALIDWAAEDNWWQANCLCPSKLRKEYDRMTMQRASSDVKNNVKTNISYAKTLKDKYKEQMKDMTFDSKYVSNIPAGKELKLDMDPKAFKEILPTLFGGRHVTRN